MKKNRHFVIWYVLEYSPRAITCVIISAPDLISALDKFKHRRNDIFDVHEVDEDYLPF